MGLAVTVTAGELAAAARTGGLAPTGIAAAGAAPPAAGPTPIPPPLGRVLAQLLLADVRARFSTGTAPDGTRWRPLAHPRPAGGHQPLRDTGVLMASLTARAEPAAVVVGTTHPAAPLHQFGGVVRPVRAKKLAIPVSREARRSGGPRRFRRKLHVVPTRKKGVLLLAETVGGKLVGHFVLVDAVTVPARPFLGVSEAALGRVARAVAEFAGRAWEQSPAGGA